MNQFYDPYFYFYARLIEFYTENVMKIFMMILVLFILQVGVISIVPIPIPSLTDLLGGGRRPRGSGGRRVNRFVQPVIIRRTRILIESTTTTTTTTTTDASVNQAPG